MSSTKPPGIDRLAQLNALHLYGMATAWSELLAEGRRRPVQPEAWLDRLIEAELVDRQVRSLRYQLKSARFPVHRDLTGSIGRKRHCRRRRSSNWRAPGLWKPRTI